MKCLRFLFKLFFGPNEFFYQREGRKFREALACGKKAKLPTLDFSGGGKIRVDPRNIVLTEKFQRQCEAVRCLAAEQRATSPTR